MAALYKINYKSDFVLTINSDVGWAVPFCIKFWTGMPSQAYFAGFDGENYVNCRVGETPTQLLVMFDDHHMPIGELKMQIAYHTTIEEFPDRKFDEVTNPTNVTVDIDGTEYQVMLDFTGETGAEIDFSMPSSGVMSVNGKIGYVTLNAEDVGAQPTIEDLATIRSGAAEGATAVQPAEMTAALATKQNVIEDLSTIRSGAADGATAVQPDEMTAALATKQNVIDDLATIRSGAAAGVTAVQPAALTPIESALQTIEAVIPSAATAQNQLADKNFVNSSISTNTANFVGTYNSLAELQSVQNPTNNDYGFVIETDAQGNEYYDRYKYVANSQQWLFEYKVESTPFTAAQWAAIQSGITSALVTKLNALPTNAELQQTLDGKADAADIPTALSQLSQDSTHRVVTDAEKSTWNGKQNAISDLATIRSGAEAGATAVQPTALQEGLAGKQDTISDLATIRSGAAAGATAVQPDEMTAALAGKQNVIEDLSTIRSGAAAGATAVQPAAMNTALAAKQDTLTFDNTPTANSDNPVKSSGIKTALDAKQSTISTVNVSVDNNTGTPSGSASVSGSTLSLSFQNLKGATGERGPQGETGPRGERGLPGESGVTGDVSGFTVIQTIDPSATYGPTDIAGAATVQATNQELTELEGTLSKKEDFSLFYPTETTDGVQFDTTTTPTTWKTQDERKLYFIPYTYKEGDYLSIIANDNNEALFAFLTSDVHTVGSVVPFAKEDQTAWESCPTGEHREVKIPSNTTFICINSAFTTSIFTPSYISVINKKIVQSEELLSDIEELGARCVSDSFESYNTEASLGIWNGDTGTIGGLDNNNQCIRAHLQISAKGYEKIKVVVPTGYYANPFFIDDKLISRKQVSSWVDGTVEIESDGKYDVILNIKKGSAGTEKMTLASLKGLVWNIELLDKKGYIPAASFNNVKENCEYSEVITGIKIGNIWNLFIVRTDPTSAIRAYKILRNVPKGKYHVKVNNGYFVSALGYVEGDVHIPLTVGWENEHTFVNNHYNNIALSFKYGNNADFTQAAIDAMVVELKHFPFEQESVMLLNSDKQTKIASLCRVHDPSAAYKTTKYFTFAQITDTHGINKTVSRAVEYLNNYQDIDMLLHTGDIQRKSFNDEQVSMVGYNAISEVIQALMGANKPFLLTLGNHDLNGAGGDAVTLSGIYGRFMQPMVDKGWLTENVNIENNATWYYKDFNKYSIRFICLNSFDPLYDGYETSKGMDDNFTKYSQGQITWLINTLLSVPVNYHVIVALHTPYDGVNGDYPTIINPDWSSTSKINAGTHGSGQPTKMSGNPMLDVLAAYKEKTTVTQSYSYNESAVQTRLGNLTVNADFTEANGVLAFMVIGHNHDDWVGEFQSKANIKCVCMPGSILTEPDSDLGRGYLDGTSNEWQQISNILEQKMQGRSQDSINVYVVRTDLRKVYIVKIGADFTTDARDRILTSFDY